MRKLHLLTALLIGALIVGCNSDMLVEEAGTIDQEETTARTIRLSTTMPGESNTRVALDQDEATGVKLEWKIGDEIYLMFDDGTNKGKSTVTLAESNIDGKKATFDINIPSSITGETFTLYGVHGGGGFVDEEDVTNFELKLPTASETIGAGLDSLSKYNAVMIKFKEETINTANPQVSVMFEHIGSLFKVVFTNDAEDNTTGHLVVNLVADSSISVYQPDEEGATFNPVNEKFTGLTTGNNLPLADGNFNVNLNNGDKVEFWGWYIPQEGETCPEFRVNVRVGAINLTTSNLNSERENGFSIGKAYRFFVSYDGSSIALTNGEGVITSEPDGNYFTDPRDFNMYKYVTIGDQTWMAENLRYIPEGVTLGDSYRIMNYNGTDIEEAKGTDEYKTFGVYYNWTTAVAGETNNYFDKVQGVCPEGWYLPRGSELNSLGSHIENDGKKLKKAGTEFWDTDNGTDDYGFAALGGGYYESEVLTDHKETAAMWESGPDGNDNAGYFYINDNGNTNRPSMDRANHLNVRCIRDTSSGGVDH